MIYRPETIGYKTIVLTRNIGYKTIILTRNNWL